MILMLMALGVQLVFAQQKTVSGTVSDENGLPLPGATVIRADTSSGTSTDFDGKYQLRANSGDVLEISYVGYTTQSITVGTGKTYADTDPKEKGEIKFMTPSGFEKSGVVSIDFVKVGDLSMEAKYLNTKEKFFSEKDLLAIKKIYDAGTKITKVNSPAVDDLYVYKIDRIIEDKNKKTVNYYGLIKIVNLKSVEANGTTTHSIGIESGEGVLK